jgi:mannose-6-phosphate isomerase-like protein (cupin superfamily)
MTEDSGTQRPWGYCEVLTSARDHRVQRITVHPGARLSLQRHQRRQEHWYVLKGQAQVTMGAQVVRLHAGDAVDIPVRTIHRIDNQFEEPFVVIEIQRGEYFGEDDIERFEDDYGRV